MKCLLATALLCLLLTANLSAQCVLSCPTADGESVQALLDATAAAGGGVVQLEPRVYSVCSPLVVGSNTHLRGAMHGATVVRAVSGFAGRTVSNSYIVSVIGAVGASNVTISDLTADIFTCDVHANVISLLPASTTGSSTYDGTVVTNATVERVETLGAPDYHSYMIWNLRGRHIRYLNNWIDGNATAANLIQEGMESYGGYDVLMSGNTVKNIGNACVTIGSGNGEIADTNTNSIRVVDNYLSGCTVGVNLTAANEIDGETTSHTLIRGNVIVDSRQFGIDVPVNAGTFQRDLQISGNTIRNITGSLGTGIRLWTVSGLTSDSNGIVGTLVEGNHIENVSGPNSFGIMVHRYPNARILNNTIIGTSAESVFVRNSEDVEIVGNRIRQSGKMSIGIYQSTGTGTMARFTVERNRLMDWLGTTSSIFVSGAKRGTVKDNVFSRTDAAVPSPITLAASSCGVTVSGNVPWYLASYSQLTSPACP